MLSSRNPPSQTIAIPHKLRHSIYPYLLRPMKYTHIHFQSMCFLLISTLFPFRSLSYFTSSIDLYLADPHSSLSSPHPSDKIVPLLPLFAHPRTIFLRSRHPENPPRMNYHYPYAVFSKSLRQEETLMEAKWRHGVYVKDG